MMDISDTLAPTSDQLDAIDLIGGPRTFTIDSVSKGNAEQPVQIALREFARVWRPGKSMRRVLAFAWGTDASKYAGRRVTLFCDPDVTFGKERTGGTRISHLSHIDKPVSIPLLVTRGKSKVFTVQPLPAEQPTPPSDTPEPTAEEVAACTDVDALRAMYRASSPARREQIQARVKELTESVPTDETLPLDGAS